MLFLDEIQAVPEALKSLRYFYEELPDLHVTAVDSLLEFALEDINFSMSVGRIKYFHLGPMQPLDFLRAIDQTGMADNLAAITLTAGDKSPLPKAVHDRYLQFFRTYWITGGLPESILVYSENNNYSDVHRIQQGIVQTCRDDFSKCSHGKMNKLVKLVYDRLPLMVGRKFKYTQMSRDYRTNELERALQQLCLTEIATRIFCTSANGLPLSAEVKPNFF